MLAVIGSIATDFVAVTPGLIHEAVAPAPDQINTSPVFYAPTMYVKDGGTGANIMYGYEAAAPALSPIASAMLFGACSHERHARLIARSTQGLYTGYGCVYASDKLDAQAHIITDPSNAQITAFHPGAMEDSIKSNERIDSYAAGDFNFAIVSPSSKDAMLDGVARFYDKGAKVFFDPGQALGLFSGEELLELLSSGQVYALICNHHEIAVITQRLAGVASHYAGAGVGALTTLVELVIVTHGAGGINFCWRDHSEALRHLNVPASAVSKEEIIDPTGCGDAFRAGFLLAAEKYTRRLGFDWTETRTTSSDVFVKCLEGCGKVGAVTAKHCLRHDGPQGYVKDTDAFLREVSEAFYNHSVLPA